jgi:hypothetical protein
MHEMTTSEMLRDPLVRQMLRADKVSLASFASLLDSAARRHAQSSARLWFGAPNAGSDTGTRSQ